MDGRPDASAQRQYPALAIQRGMVLHALREPDGGVDMQQLTFSLDEPVDRAAFEATWRAALHRHAALQTFFRVHGEDGLVQVVDPDAELDLRFRAPDDAPELGEFLDADRFERFDFARAPLFRVTVLPRPSGRADVSFTFHHSILDGRSMRLLVDEILTEYRLRRAGQVPQHPVRPEFEQFVRWWGAADLSAAEPFWREYLADPVIGRSLPGSIGDSGRAEPATEEIGLSRAESDRLRAACVDAGVGVSTVLNAAWALLRAGYGGVDDVAFAVTRSCRYGSIPDADAVLGMLINTIPFRLRIDPQWTVRELLAATAAGMRGVREHQLASLTSILDWAGLAPDTPLLDSLVVFERQRLHIGLGQDGPEPARDTVRMRRLPGYPLSLYGFDEPELRLAAMWDSRRLLDSSVHRMLDQWRAAVLELADRLDARVRDLDLGVAGEAALRARWNGTARPYARESTIPELFRAQVARQPDADALVFGDHRVSYAQLDAHSDRLAWALHRRGVRTDEPVAVAIPRGTALVPALLAVLKAGGAYLPMDLSSPPARLSMMLRGSGVRLVLTVPETVDQLRELGDVPVLDVHELARVSAPDGPPPVRLHPLHLAQLIYTSGSTGVPKGVAIPHRGVLRFVNEPDYGTFAPGERVLQFAPTAFDASTLEIWGTLLNGATLVVAPPDPVGLGALGALLRTGGVTIAFFTTGLFHQLAEDDPQALAGIGQIYTGGDVTSPDAVRAVVRVRDGKPVGHAYGPAENTCFTTYHAVHGTERLGERIPIGAPIQQTTVQVCDPDGRPVPIGFVGELYTGGDGLARGYLGEPVATARVFVPDPDRRGERLYRTGDLARWRADGVLEFLGRVDNQVKIRGFRVEPGEIEAVLKTHPAVAEAVVTVRGGGAQRYLVGYVTTVDGADVAALRPARLRQYLTGRLPEYLVPAGFAVLERIPLTVHGKVDRAALPPPEPDGTADDAAPQTPTEQRLAEVWLRLLPADLRTAGIARDVSFFALGGNSLSTARLMFRIQETFGVELKLGDFYREPTLAATAAAIDAAGGSAAAIAPVPAVPALRRRDRSAHRVGGERATATSPSTVDSPSLPSHLADLGAGWGLWRTICLRTAGFPMRMLAALGDESLAIAADRLNADGSTVDGDSASRYREEFLLAVRRHDRALRAVAADPAFREAVTWQNANAVGTGLDALLRHDPARPRNSKHRQHETLVASYLQRYCAKNDTIGFFGPVGWADVDAAGGIRFERADPPALLAARTVYLEGWAVVAVLAPHAQRLRPWLVPRRMPFLALAGDTLHVPLAEAVTLAPEQAEVLRACDGVRPAHEVAAAVLRSSSALGASADVYRMLDELAAAHRIAWQVEVAPHDTRPEHSMRALLAGVTDEAVRAPALAALDELCGARDTLAAAAGDPDAVATAMSDLNATFTRLAGVPATRRAGALYAGRTVVYEECLRGDTVHFGQSAFERIHAPLRLVLDSARWFTAAGAALYRKVLDEAYRRRAGELGSGTVPLRDLWLRVGEMLFNPPERLTTALARALQRRWAEILDVPEGERRVQRGASALAAGVAAAFPTSGAGWPSAVQHSPDLMLAGADPDDQEALWVLGELHPGVNTLRYATWVAYHGAPDGLRAAMASDLGRPTVFAAESAQENGVPTRQSNVFDNPRDRRLVFAHDSFGYGPERSLLIGECDVVDSPAGLRVRQRDGDFEDDLLAVLGDVIAMGMSQHFRIVPPARHTPRVTIDSLVVSRESWTFEAVELAFAGIADEALRYPQMRAWAARHGLPRYVFLRCAGERKPVYADLTSLASTDLISRAIRRARQHGGDTATVSVSEMLPAPDQLWFADAAGHRYSAELRVVAVDRRVG